MSNLAGLSVPKSKQYCPLCKRDIDVVSDKRAPGGVKYVNHYPERRPESTGDIDWCRNSGQPVVNVSKDHF